MIFINNEILLLIKIANFMLLKEIDNYTSLLKYI